MTDRRQKLTRFLRVFFGWTLIILAFFPCVSSAILTVTALFGGLETESFIERMGFFVTYAAMTAFFFALARMGFRLRKPAAPQRPADQPRNDPPMQDPPPETPRNDPPKPIAPPARQEGTSLWISAQGFTAWKYENRAERMYELQGVMTLMEKQPVITLYEDGVKVREYCLQTEGDEDFTGKFFHFSIRLGMPGNPPAYTAQLDGFISDTPEKRSMSFGDIGYRMEGYYFTGGTEAGRARYETLRGQDLPMKGLEYPGYITPSNVRLIGVCPDCGRSFAFRGYAFYRDQKDVAYSDDGLDCCAIEGPVEHKEAWACESGGRVFRYYNSFCCPHCGTPYIDYRKYPRNKVFGVSGCVHLGRKEYHISWEDAKRPWTGRPNGPIDVVRALSRTEDAAGACYSFERTLHMEDLVKAGDRYYLRVTDYTCTAGANGRPDYVLTETYFEAAEDGSHQKAAAWVCADSGTGVLF